MSSAPRELPVRVTIQIEVPRWSFVKRQAGLGIEYISPLPCPYNYGFIVGTLGEDGEPLDALLLGRRVRAGTRVEAPVLGCIRFLDAGLVDDKLVCGDALGRAEYVGLTLFFMLYALARAALNCLQYKSGRTAYCGFVRGNID